MRIGFVEWPEGLIADSPQWFELVRGLAAARLDILVTNELPFGPWIAAAEVFEPKAAKHSIACHQAGLQALIKLNIPAVISSRPVWEGSRLANEAFSLEAGAVNRLHAKQYFPAEAGWFESN